MSNNTRICSYSRTSPVDFHVEVSADDPFEIVLLQTYAEGWVMTTNHSDLVDYSHKSIASFANSWTIEKSGNYSISFHHTAQDALNLGAAIAVSVAAFTLSSFFIDYTKIKGKVIYVTGIIKNIRKKSSDVTGCDVGND